MKLEPVIPKHYKDRELSRLRRRLADCEQALQRDNSPALQAQRKTLANLVRLVEQK